MYDISILSVILAIFIFGLLIFVHEGGHFFFARLFKVTVNEFAIGMGPKIFSRKSEKSGIVYSLRLLPFGGFVSMAGEDDESDDENAFYKKAVWKRIIITAAGAVVNILIGIIVMSVLVFSSDVIGSNVVAEFVEVENGAVSTEDQGLAVDDVITHINGTRVFTYSDLHYEISRQGIKPVDITVLRGGEKLVIEDVSFPVYSEAGTSFGSRDFKVYREDKTFTNLLKHAAVRSYSTIKMVYDSVYDLITGRYGMESVSGPVGVTEALSQAASSRFSDFIYLVAFLSINLGVMNLLPFPALDGGRIVFQFIELVFRRPVPVKVEGFVNFVGLALLMLLIVIVTCKDIAGFFI